MEQTALAVRMLFAATASVRTSVRRRFGKSWKPSWARAQCEIADAEASEGCPETCDLTTHRWCYGYGLSFTADGRPTQLVKSLRKLRQSSASSAKPRIDPVSVS